MTVTHRHTTKNGTIYKGGGDSQATDAVYRYTQFVGNFRGKLTGRFALANKKSRSSPNLREAQGLAAEHSSDFAIPRGDCSKSESESQRNITSEECEQVN